MVRLSRWWFVLALVPLLFVASNAHAQYFGRNKVQYRTFTFEILKTDHFDLYFYPEEAEAAQIVARMAERWYTRLSRFFGHELRGRQAVILYAVSAHFRQTNAVEGLIGEGTGGVTEAIKRRVVLPMSGSLADTDHVLGHELVHAFQFDLTGDDPRDTMATMPDILAYPLWFVEGMAEYLSLGPVDAQTSMWLRDAALRERLPHIRQLDSPEYFPYRWGHAFWAYIGAKYGDRTVASLIRSAANPRTDLEGLARQLGTDPDTLTADWHKAIRDATSAIAAEDMPLTSDVRLAIDKHSGGGRYNIGPRLSPDGREMVFFSSRDRFSVDLFLADVETGRIKRKLSQSATDPHFDSLEFLNSAGTWSPDGASLVISAVRGGRPVLAFIDPKSGRVHREVELKDLDDALNPAFSPDGKAIVVSGNRGGLIDLYRVWLASGEVNRLTSDPFADLEPAFTPDGKGVVFVTERYTTNLETLEPGSLRLAYLDLATRDVKPIPAFLRGRHLSPQVSADGRSVTFISDPDGVSNLYRMPIDGGPVMRITSVPTGVAGITTASPALSASARSGRLAFSVFEDDGHSIYVLDEAGVVALVAPEATGRAALLPGRTTPTGDVQRYLSDTGRGLPAETQAAKSAPEPYKRKLTLDAVGQPTFTTGVSDFGGYVGGSISAFFSDMLGDRVLGMSAQVAGSFADLGGNLTYLSRRHRWNWAAAIDQSPFRVRYIVPPVTDPAAGEVRFTEVTERQTSRGVFAGAAFPFNTASRVEFSGGGRSLSFTREERTRVYAADSQRLIDTRESSADLAAPIHLGQASVALVYDTSYFGATSPIFGTRARLDITKSVGTLDYTTAMADWRRYFMPARPVTIAARFLHLGRYGPDGQDPRLIDLYVGHQEFVHGYSYGSFNSTECPESVDLVQCGVYDNLLGSRMLVANIEARAPLAGLFSGELDYGRVPVEVAVFYDAGVAWTNDTLPTFAGGTRHVIRSLGGAARVNVFGLLIVEIAASRPYDRAVPGWRWQLGLRQGF